MNDIINIEILDREGHGDLKFCIKNLTADLIFDTYYFALSIEPFDHLKDLKVCIAQFLQKWLTEIEIMQSGQDRYFPIDLSDQYTGCLRVTKQNDEMEISYGISKREGYTIDVNKPDDYFNGISDFRSDTPGKLTVKQSDFKTSLKMQMDKLLALV